MQVYAQNGISIYNQNVKTIDVSTPPSMKISEAPEDLYQGVVNSQEKMLEARYTQYDDTSQNQRYKPYATIEVNGKAVAQIDNHGFTQTSNALSGKIQDAIKQADRNSDVLQGPDLAQARAEKIAELLGGMVVKSSTAMTQSQFNTAPAPRATIDYAAMQADPAYEQLMKTKEARTLFITQQIAQQNDMHDVGNESDAVKAFRGYMEMTPEERFYNSILHEMGLTQEKLDALPPEERIKAEAEIQKKIEERLATASEKDQTTDPLEKTYATGFSNEMVEQAGDNSLEQYQIPDWYAQYGKEVSQNIGGKVDDAEKGSAAERAEYSSRVREHYEAVLAAAGIETSEGLYNNTVINKEINENLKQNMAERVNNDDRLLELMHNLGKIS